MAHKVGATINELYTLPHELIILHNIAQMEFLAGSGEFCARSGLDTLDGIQLTKKENISDARFSDGSWKKVQANPELCLAVETGKLEIVKLLHSHGAFEKKLYKKAARNCYRKGLYRHSEIFN